MKLEGKTADEILKNKLIDRSSWHFFQSKSWIDYALRNSNPSAIQYASFELRYGIEYFLFELLVITRNLTEEEYKKAQNSRKEMKRLLKDANHPYEKLNHFTKAAMRIDGHNFHPFELSLNQIFNSWAKASDYLHVLDSHQKTFLSDDWISKSISTLTEEVDKFYGKTNIALLRVETMPSSIRQVWEDYKKGRIDIHSVDSRLRILKK